ncbi:MAG: efflux RND transporter periplasmic adaptor subunit [Desulfobulbaceae bacterium]|nr:efflux RND transporter periplasmic adaptor subunit [Desulfobulbaceae bacterium]
MTHSIVKEMVKGNCMKLFTIGISLALMWVAMSPVIAAGLPETVELDAMIEPHQTVEIRSPVEGLIKEITVERGDFVTKDQPLVKLESGQEEATAALWWFRSRMEAPIQSAMARCDFSERKEKRLSQLYGEEFASQADKEEAEAEQQLAEAQLVEAKENRQLAELELLRAKEVLSARTLKSPFSGVVVERFLNPGAVVVAGSGEKKPILKLAALDPLYVEIAAPLALMGKITKGTIVEVRPEVPEGAVYEGVVSVVDLVADAPSGTFVVRVELANPEMKISAGIKCKVRIPVQKTP